MGNGRSIIATAYTEFNLSSHVQFKDAPILSSFQGLEDDYFVMSNSLFSDVRVSPTLQHFSPAVEFADGFTRYSVSELQSLISLSLSHKDFYKRQTYLSITAKFSLHFINLYKLYTLNRVFWDLHFNNRRVIKSVGKVGVKYFRNFINQFGNVARQVFDNRFKSFKARVRDFRVISPALPIAFVKNYMKKVTSLKWPYMFLGQHVLKSYLPSKRTKKTQGTTVIGYLMNLKSNFKFSSRDWESTFFYSTPEDRRRSSGYYKLKKINFKKLEQTAIALGKTKKIMRNYRKRRVAKTPVFADCSLFKKAKRLNLINFKKWRRSAIKLEVLKNIRKVEILKPRVVFGKNLIQKQFLGLYQFFFEFSEFFREYTASLFKFCKYSVKAIKKISKIRKLFQIFYHNNAARGLLGANYGMPRVIKFGASGVVRSFVSNGVYDARHRVTPLLLQFARRYLKFSLGVSFRVPKFQLKFAFKILNYKLNFFPYNFFIFKIFLRNYQVGYLDICLWSPRNVYKYRLSGALKLEKFRHFKEFFNFNPYRYSMFNVVRAGVMDLVGGYVATSVVKIRFQEHAKYHKIFRPRRHNKYLLYTAS